MCMYAWYTYIRFRDLFNYFFIQVNCLYTSLPLMTPPTVLHSVRMEDFALRLEFALVSLAGQETDVRNVSGVSYF